MYPLCGPLPALTIPPHSSKGFGSVKTEKGADEAAAPEGGVIGIADEDKKWRLAAYDVDEWQVGRGAAGWSEGGCYVFLAWYLLMPTLVPSRLVGLGTTAEAVCQLNRRAAQLLHSGA